MTPPPPPATAVQAAAWAARRLAEAPPSLRWHAGRLRSALIYRPAFGSFGAGSVIVKPRVLRGVERIHIGAGCAIYDGAWLACEPGGGPIRIGDQTYLGHDVHVHAVDPITIGARCFLVDGVYIGSADHDRATRSTATAAGPVVLGDDVFVGQRAIILGGVTIGAGATIAAGAVVTCDVAAGEVVAGVPATPVSSRRGG